MRAFCISLIVLTSSLSAAALEERFAQEVPTQEVTNSNIHGFLEFRVKNDYVTPRGLYVTNTGVTTQTLLGLAFDVYKNPEQFINNVSIFGFIWNDFWSKQHHKTAGAWNELDWGFGTNVTFAKHCTFGVQFIEFVSPPGNFKPEKNIEFTLAYDDSYRQFPIAFKPYAKLFWAVTGDSTVVVGKRGHTYDVELGLVPTWDLHKYDVNLVLSLPTWITTGPANFWNGGKLGLKNERAKFGVVSTGLRGEVAINFIPKSFGNWYLDVGCQYYHMINDNLLQAQTVTLGVRSLDRAHRNVYVAYAGIGLRF